jgi:hypothetical protein
MQKKTCTSCGKIWILEKFDTHPCAEIPKKARAKKEKKAI